MSSFAREPVSCTFKKALPIRGSVSTDQFNFLLLSFSTLPWVSEKVNIHHPPVHRLRGLSVEEMKEQRRREKALRGQYSINADFDKGREKESER